MNVTLIDALTLSVPHDLLHYMSLGLLDLSSPQQQAHVAAVLEKSIEDAYSQGKAEGYDNGYDDGYQQGYDSGSINI